MEKLLVVLVVSWGCAYSPEMVPGHTPETGEVSLSPSVPDICCVNGWPIPVGMYSAKRREFMNKQ
jgi:hypothetical protein